MQKLVVHVIVLAAASLVAQSLRNHGQDYYEEPVATGLPSLIDQSSENRPTSQDDAINHQDAAVMHEVARMQGADFETTRLEFEVASDAVLNAQHAAEDADAAIVAERQALRQDMLQKQNAAKTTSEQKARADKAQAVWNAESDKLRIATKTFKKADRQVADDEAELLRLKEVSSGAKANLEHLRQTETAAKAEVAKKQVMVAGRGQSTENAPSDNSTEAASVLGQAAADDWDTHLGNDYEDETTPKQIEVQTKSSSGQGDVRPIDWVPEDASLVHRDTHAIEEGSPKDESQTKSKPEAQAELKLIHSDVPQMPAALDGGIAPQLKEKEAAKLLSTKKAKTNLAKKPAVAEPAQAGIVESLTNGTFVKQVGTFFEEMVR